MECRELVVGKWEVCHKPVKRAKAGENLLTPCIIRLEGGIAKLIGGQIRRITTVLE